MEHQTIINTIRKITILIAYIEKITYELINTKYIQMLYEIHTNYTAI